MLHVVVWVEHEKRDNQVLRQRTSALGGGQYVCQ